MTKNYRQEPVTRAELEALAALAESEEQAFFARNEHLIPMYGDRRIAIALCQGAALQFVGRGHGVNDFDIHFFYARNPAKPRLSRTVRRVVEDVGAFAAVPVDFIRTVVPEVEGPSTPVDRIRCFLRYAPTANAVHLAEKAVVGLLPRELFGVTIWPAV